MPFLPQSINLAAHPILFGGNAPTLTLDSPLKVFVGPNGAGKTETLKLLRDRLRQILTAPNRHIVYLSAGRSSPLEGYRSSSFAPRGINATPAAVGNQSWTANWWQIEGSPGIFLRLKERGDLLLKVQARLQSLYQRSLRLEWSQSGLQVGFVPTTGGTPYFANVEASGLLHLIPLLAAVYHDGISALLIDEPEISMHPQLQAFLLREMRAIAGEPSEPGKKLIIIATHSSTMLPIRTVFDITRLMFFTDRQSAPIQIPTTTGELKNRRLSALVSRLSENHKLAFFARNVLLVEGPSDEIIITGLSLKLDQPLLESNTQVVPVTAKGQISETLKLFRLMGKRVFVLADLDALVDDNQLVNSFRESARVEANSRGMESLTEIDRAIRDKFNELLHHAWSVLGSAAITHRYWTAPRDQTLEDELKAKKRATLAALLSNSELSQSDSDLNSLRIRYEALIELLAKAGCVILRRGTIEDYFFASPHLSTGKPEAAAAEMASLSSRELGEIRSQYGDVIQAIEIAAPAKRIDERALLREQLGGLLGSIMQFIEVGMSDDELTPVQQLISRLRRWYSAFQIGLFLRAPQQRIVASR